MTNATKSAVQALIDYGYTETDGLFQRGLTDAWRREGDGFLMLRPAAPTVGSAEGVANPAAGAAWGMPVEGVPGWVQVPYRQSDRFATASGLHPLTHPECFEWVWPGDVVAERYEFASPQGDNPYIRVNDVLIRRED